MSEQHPSTSHDQLTNSSIKKGEVVHDVEKRQLDARETVTLDPEAWLAAPRETYEKLGVDGAVLAEIDAGGKAFVLIKLFDQPEHAKPRSNDYVVIDHSFIKDNSQGFKGIHRGHTTTFGRNHHYNRFLYPPTTSGDHFQVRDDGELTITNLNPTNGTVITMPPPAEHPDDAIYANRTIYGVERVRNKGHFAEKKDTAPYGFYQNYPILGRNSKQIEGGVYLGGSAREAIVVDHGSQSVNQQIDGVKNHLQSAIDNKAPLSTPDILRFVNRTVETLMAYDADKVREISSHYKGDKLVDLSTFVHAGVGVCRHQGLFAAMIMERLITDGYLHGTTGIERNTIKDSDNGGTHAWAVYREGDSTYIIDPAQSFVGTKTQARHEKRWRYDLPMKS